MAQGVHPNTWRGKNRDCKGEPATSGSLAVCTLKMAEFLVSLGANPHLPVPFFIKDLENGNFQRAAFLLRTAPPGPWNNHLASNNTKEIYNRPAQQWQRFLAKTEVNPSSLAVTDALSESFILLKMLENPEVQAYLQSPDNYYAQFTKKCKDLVNSDEIHITKELYERFDVFALPTQELQYVMGLPAPNAVKNLGQTMLMWSCIFGHRHIVEKLVTMGLPRKYINTQDIYGRTALMYALLYGNVDCALTLMHHRRFNADGSQLLDKDGNQVVTNHCGSGIYLLDAQDRSALFYTIYASLADDSILVTEPDGRDWEMSAFDYSLNRGALKIYDILKAKGVKFSPRARVSAMAIKMAAEFGKPLFLLKELGLFKQQQNVRQRP